jgi:hypothetical protein
LRPSTLDQGCYDSSRDRKQGPEADGHSQFHFLEPAVQLGVEIPDVTLEIRDVLLGRNLLSDSRLSLRLLHGHSCSLELLDEGMDNVRILSHIESGSPRS